MRPFSCGKTRRSAGNAGGNIIVPISVWRDRGVALHSECHWSIVGCLSSYLYQSGIMSYNTIEIRIPLIKHADRGATVTRIYKRATRRCPVIHDGDVAGYPRPQCMRQRGARRSARREALSEWHRAINDVEYIRAPRSNSTSDAILLSMVRNWLHENSDK